VPQDIVYKPKWLAASVVLASLLVAPPSPAADASAAQCESAYEGVQLLRQRGELLAARDQAALCSRDACPEVGRRDCARWAEELAREIPTVVVVARDEADRDVPAARLLVDGTPRAELVSGRPFELDPGAHVFRVERTGASAIEQSFTIYQGERGRLLRVTVPRADVAVAPRLPLASPVPAAPPSPPVSERPSVLPAAVVGGLSVAALVTSAVLGLTGRQQLSDLRSSCAPACADDQVNPVRTRLVVSDVTLGAGLVGAAIAISLFALRGSF
jgi:hypothetical protein